MELPGKWGREEHMGYTAWLTGRTPREIRRLRDWLYKGVTVGKGDWEKIINSKDPLKWAESRSADLMTEFNRWQAKQTEKETKEFEKFMDKLFLPSWVGKPAQRTAGEVQVLLILIAYCAGAFFDTGLVYYDEVERNYVCTSFPARQCLMQYYYSSSSIKLLAEESVHVCIFLTDSFLGSQNAWNVI